MPYVDDSDRASTKHHNIKMYMCVCVFVCAHTCMRVCLCIILRYIVFGLFRIISYI